MQDPFERRVEELTWDEIKIRQATPEQLIGLINDFKECVSEQIKDGRFTFDALEHRVFSQHLGAVWGQWSAQFNRVLRAMIKESELFETRKMRFYTKKLATTYLFWTKCNSLIELTNNPLSLIDTMRTVQAMTHIEDVQKYFNNLKMDKEEKENG